MTKSQREEKLNEIYNFIKTFISVKNYPPSYREISLATNVKSTNSVKDYIDKLVDKNLIKISKSKNRCLELVGDKVFTINTSENAYSTDLEKRENNLYLNDIGISSLPLIGQVAAGIPILAEQNIEDKFYFSSSLFHTNQKLFMLRVKGDSMINIGIDDGDLVIVKEQNTAENGEVVVAMIDGYATVKNYYREKDYIRLQPQNDTFAPIISKNVAILGKVINVIKYI